MSGNGWESNPPRLFRPDTDFEDQEAHQDLTIPETRIIQTRFFFNLEFIVLSFHPSLKGAIDPFSLLPTDRN